MIMYSSRIVLGCPKIYPRINVSLRRILLSLLLTLCWVISITTWFQSCPSSSGEYLRTRTRSSFHYQDTNRAEANLVKMTGDEVPPMPTNAELLQKLDALGKRCEDLEKQRNEEARLRQEALDAAAATATAQGNPGLNDTVSASRFSFVNKSNIETPALEDKMTFEDYKFKVQIWRKFAENHIPKEELGQLLINRLPAKDPKMLLRTVTERIGLENLRKENTIDRVLDELANILQAAPFPRLMEWIKKWESFSQGNMSFESFTLRLRTLAKSAKDEFGFQIPPGMQVAKLLLAANDVNASNISLITDRLKLDGPGQSDTLYNEVETRLKTFVSNTNTFASVKTATTTSGAYAATTSDFVSRDWKGNPIIDSPEKNLNLI